MSGSALLHTLLLAVLSASTLHAQRNIDVWIAASGAAVGTRSALDVNGQRFGGFALGGQGRLAVDHLSLLMSYSQGTLRAHDTRLERQYVEGYAMFGVAPLPFLEFTVGPHARAYTTDAVVPVPGIDLEVYEGDEPPSDAFRIVPGVTQRWLLWEVRGRVDAPIYEMPHNGTSIRVFAEGRAVPAGSVNVAEKYDSGRGGEAGIAVRIAEPPLAVRFSYAIDESRLGSGARRETVESVTLAVGIALGSVGFTPVAALRSVVVPPAPR